MITEYSPLTLISKYRNAVMGLAIVGVMLGHWMGLSGTQADTLLTNIISIIPALVSTQGFLFISGYGIYYSFSKNSDVIPFYKRRFYRMLVPYMLMALPYFMFRLIFEGIGIWQFVGYLTTISYWMEGNYCGMWYVAVSVVLYLLSPMIYKVYFGNKSFWHTTLCLMTTLTLAVTTNHLLFAHAQEYYLLFFNGLERYFMFFIGIYCGYLSRQEKKQRITGIVIVACMLPTAYMLAWTNPEYGYLTAAARRLVITIPLISVAFAMVDKVHIGNSVMAAFNWLGTYTFELYILHLLVYCFLISKVLGLELSNKACITIAIVIAFLLCVPVQKGIKSLTPNK